MVNMFIARISMTNGSNMQIRWTMNVKTLNEAKSRYTPVTLLTVRDPVILQALPSDL